MKFKLHGGSFLIAMAQSITKRDERGFLKVKWG